MRILVIEDEVMVLKSIEFKLKKEGFEVITAPDGKVAYEMLSEEPIDMIITDLMIPYYSGLELINHVRSDLKSKVPIIVLSAMGQEESILEAFRLGANDYMTKPFIPNELIIRIRKEALR
jgi:two-component system response regulator VicR